MTIPREPITTITAFTAEGLPRRANDWAVLRSLPCGECGAAVSEPCQRWLVCELRLVAAHAVLAAVGRALLEPAA